MNLQIICSLAAEFLESFLIKLLEDDVEVESPKVLNR